jgi:hypothetical protein
MNRHGNLGVRAEPRSNRFQETRSSPQAYAGGLDPCPDPAGSVVTRAAGCPGKSRGTRRFESRLALSRAGALTRSTTTSSPRHCRLCASVHRSSGNGDHRLMQWASWVPCHRWSIPRRRSSSAPTRSCSSRTSVLPSLQTLPMKQPLCRTGHAPDPRSPLAENQYSEGRHAVLGNLGDHEPVASVTAPRPRPTLPAEPRNSHQPVSKNAGQLHSERSEAMVQRQLSWP